MFLYYSNLGNSTFQTHSSCKKDLPSFIVDGAKGAYSHWEKIIIDFRNEPKARLLQRLAISRCGIYYGNVSLDGSLTMLKTYQAYQKNTSILPVYGIKLTIQDFDCAKKRIEQEFSNL